MNSLHVIIIILSVCCVASLCLFIWTMVRLQRRTNEYEDKIHWYVNMLDSIPFPISVTDNNRNWTFINKPVEGMLSVKREDCIGKQCYNWGAGICKTDNCGIDCLNAGKSETTFTQLGSHFQVNIAYLHNKTGKKVGHIEVVQDISTMTNAVNVQRNIIKDSGEVCNKLVTLAKTVDDQANKIVDGASDQTAAVEELVATVGEIASKVKDNAAYVHDSTTKTEQVGKEATGSTEQMNHLLDSMERITTASKEINNIITSIESIATQTKMLSLNASIESARAGEAGRGFAVVAGQIGELAAQSAEAANTTRKLIETAINAAENGNQITNATADLMKRVAESILDVKNSSLEIEKASTQQSLTIDQIYQTLEQISTVIQDNSEVAELSSKSSQELYGQIEELKNIINR